MALSVKCLTPDFRLVLGSRAESRACSRFSPCPPLAPHSLSFHVSLSKERRDPDQGTLPLKWATVTSGLYSQLCHWGTLLESLKPVLPMRQPCEE